MEISLKQRLVGAAVIVALAVIIIPILLDGSGNDGVRGIPPAPKQTTASDQGTIGEHAIPLPPDESQATVVTGPTAPAAPSAQAPATTSAQAPAPQPVSPAGPSASSPAQAQAPVQASAPAPAQAKAPEPAPAKLPSTAAVPKDLKTWVVQVGSFGDEGKAMALRDRLRKAHFNAFVDRFDNGAKGSMYRVRVGPELDRAKAEALQKRLQKEQKLKGFVTQHS